ncbi:MAG: hypothetical protein JKX92_04910 [Porticoccaceae bacterium]|nr:hypothetical protein [Porticoccaceae bacterium]
MIIKSLLFVTCILFSLTAFAINNTAASGSENAPVALFYNQPSSQTPHKYGVSSVGGEVNTRGLALGVSVLQIELPSGEIINLNNRGVDRRKSDDLAWFGEVAGNADSDVSLTLKNGLVFGRIRIGADVFELRSDIDGWLTIVKNRYQHYARL